MTAVRGPAKVLDHQAAEGHMSAPPRTLTTPIGLPHQAHVQLQPQPQAAQKLFGAAASTASCLHSQGVPTQRIIKLSPGTVYVTTGHHQSQQSVPPQETSAQPLWQPAHSLAADLSGQAGANAAAARSEQRGPPLTETVHKAQPALHAGMQRHAVSEGCPAQPSQHQQHRVQTPTAQQTGQHLLREQSTHPPQHQQNTQELWQQLQVPQPSRRDAGSAAPGLRQQQEQQRPHANANGHAEGMAEAEQESWSSTDSDDDFADWEQHILASAAPEPAGAGAEQQSAGKSGLKFASKLPTLTSGMSAKNLSRTHAPSELIAACTMHVVRFHCQIIELHDASGARADYHGQSPSSPNPPEKDLALQGSTAQFTLGHPEVTQGQWQVSWAPTCAG